MMVMTAKVNMRKILTILAIVAGVVLALILLLGGSNNEPAGDATATMSNNDARVKFLTDMGWEVSTSPTESSQVRIPEEATEVFDRYNALQKSQGYDLSQYAGKTVMRYIYKINNFPGATEPVYATVLVYKNQIIGGDITNTAADGAIQGFRKDVPPETTPQTTPSELTTAESADSAI